MYDSYNVTTCPMNIVTTYPMVVFLLEMLVHQKPGLHTSGTNPTNIYMYYM